MSDYTAYVRGQREERGKTQTGRFMKDGFDRWAESSAPARVGQVEKEPAEATSTMREVGGVLPLAAMALPAAAGLATGIYAGVKGERKVQKMRQQIAREERAKRGTGRFSVKRSPRGQESWSLYDNEMMRFTGQKFQTKADADAAAAQGGVLPLLPAAAVAAAPYVLPAAAGFATGIYAGVKGQRKVDQLRQQIAREERQKYSGMGFREGIRETQNLYGNMADAAISGYDAYEAAQKGFSGLPTALQKGADVASAISKATASAQKAAAEFQKGGAKKSDGRAARAAIVKQVMAQRGVSMIEASKIVKAEGLY